MCVISMVAIHFHRRLATRAVCSSKQRNASNQNVNLKLREAQLSANEQQSGSSSGQLQTGNLRNVFIKTSRKRQLESPAPFAFFCKRLLELAGSTMPATRMLADDCEAFGCECTETHKLLHRNKITASPDVDFFFFFFFYGLVIMTMTSRCHLKTKCNYRS